MSAARTISKGGDYQVEAEELDESLTLRFMGKISEDVDFNQIQSEVLARIKSDTKVVIFDMAEVNQINSVGIRAWLLFLERVQVKSQVAFSRLSEVIADQASIVPNLLGKKGTPIIRVEVPFYCEKDDKRELKMLKKDDIITKEGTISVPTFSCGKCGRKLDLDAIPEEYFAFLKR